MATFFLHGVPDTPFMWTPLISALGLGPTDYVAPALPGFVSPLPAGFDCSKEAYLDWLIDALERQNAQSGPVDIIGHDWGAILCLRAAHLRPDLVRSWALCNVVPISNYRWHLIARIWQTPLLGELAMALSWPSSLQAMLVKSGMPKALAEHEVSKVDGDMKRAILRLYRSAKALGQEWGTDHSGLSQHGLVLWGGQDPFVPLKLAEQFCQTSGIPLHQEPAAGHWAAYQCPQEFAVRLKAHWQQVAPR